MGVEILPFRKRRRNELTLQERDFRVEQVFDQWILENLDIWLVVVEAASKRKHKKFIAASEISSIIDVYEATHHLGDISVGELVRTAGVADLSEHYFLSKVCFNYDFTIDAKERYREAEAPVELKEGRRSSVSVMEFWNVKQWVDHEFNNPSFLQSGAIERSDLFDRETQVSQEAYWIRFYLDRSALQFFTVREYERKVIPFLGRHEAVKAGVERYFTRREVKPKVVQKYL